MARHGDGIYARGETFYLEFQHKGMRHRERLGSHIGWSTAREIAQVTRAAILKGEVGIGRKRTDVLFDTAAERFLTWAKTTKRAGTAKVYASHVRQLKITFTGKRLGEITKDMVEKHQARRLEAGAKVAANRELAALRQLINRALGDKSYEGANPAVGVDRLKESVGRLRFLEPDEEVRLLAQLDEPYRTLALAGIHAGLRVRSEGLSLTWRDIDLVRGLLTVPADIAKNGRERKIRINSVLLPALRALKARPLVGLGQHVFTRRDGRPLANIRNVFRRACRRAGLDADVTPHVLRHTFASRLTMAGVPPQTIMVLGGWQSLAMVQRYSHLSPEHQADAVERLATFEVPPGVRHAASPTTLPLNGAAQVG
jgi:integrase